MRLYRDLATVDGVTVAHVTHRHAECRVADRVLTLEHGHLVPSLAGVDAGEAAAAPPVDRASGAALMTLRGVGHVYAYGTPWAQRALTDVDLDIDAGEGVLVLGHNGSGKSTLAWILAGLVRPTEGTATLGGVPTPARVGTVGLAFQHARLQLLRTAVASEVAAASGADPATVASTLAAVGLDPDRFASRRVDELSGGEMRRVALAGLLARHPAALVLDEPLAGLDEPGRAGLARLLVELRARVGLTIVIVSHDHELPGGLVDRVVELQRGRVAAVRPYRAEPAARGGSS
jgi:energy-coupling factor transport system ATP-binding protein